MLSDRITDIAYDLGVHALVIQRMTKSGFAAHTAGAEHMSGSSQLIHDGDIVGVLNEFTPVDEAEKHSVSAEEIKNLRTLTFAKLREEAPRRHVHLVQRPGIPAFADWARPTISLEDV